MSKEPISLEDSEKLLETLGKLDKHSLEHVKEVVDILIKQSDD